METDSDARTSPLTQGDPPLHTRCAEGVTLVQPCGCLLPSPLLGTSALLVPATLEAGGEVMEGNVSSDEFLFADAPGHLASRCPCSPGHNVQLKSHLCQADVSPASVLTA